jgi:hypothetical protein
MGSAFFIIGLLIILALNYLFWVEGWNLIAKAILKIKPDLDLRICQDFKSRYEPTQGKTLSSPVHSGVQGVIYLVFMVATCMTSYYTVALYVTAVFR